MTYTGGPAFPGSYTGQNGAPVWSDGMTLLDYFAAHALQGLLTKYDHSQQVDSLLVERAYRLADLMLQER